MMRSGSCISVCLTSESSSYTKKKNRALQPPTPYGSLRGKLKREMEKTRFFPRSANVSLRQWMHEWMVSLSEPQHCGRVRDATLNSLKWDYWGTKLRMPTKQLVFKCVEIGFII